MSLIEKDISFSKGKLWGLNFALENLPREILQEISSTRLHLEELENSRKVREQ